MGLAENYKFKGRGRMCRCKRIDRENWYLGGIHFQRATFDSSERGGREMNTLNFSTGERGVGTMQETESRPG